MRIAHGNIERTYPQVLPFEKPLSPAERRVYDGLIDGKAAVEIARELWVSEHTVRSQIKSIKLKLGVSTQTMAIVMYYKLAMENAA